MKRTYLILAVTFVTMAAVARPAAAQDTNRPSVGFIGGWASSPGAIGSRGLDLGFAGELPIETVRIRGELGFTGMDSPQRSMAATGIRRASIGIVRPRSADPARPFIGAGFGRYAYRTEGQPDRALVAGYIGGGFEIVGRRRAFTGELRVTAPLDDAPGTPPMHAGLLIGVKRLF